MASFENKVRQRAEQLWIEAGRPSGGPGRFTDRARELTAIEQGTDQARKPNPMTQPERPEPVEAVENLGEFPGLTDQGEAESFPHRRGQGDED